MTRRLPAAKVRAIALPNLPWFELCLSLALLLLLYSQ
jgi:hypothetical protein